MGTDRSTQRGISGAMKGDEWCTNGGGDMHRATVASNQQVGALEQCRELRQIRFASQVQGPFAGAFQDGFDNGKVARSAGDHDACPIFAHQAIN